MYWCLLNLLFFLATLNELKTWNAPGGQSQLMKSFNSCFHVFSLFSCLAKLSKLSELNATGGQIIEIE